MDIVTQGLFGAVVAQAAFRRPLGRRALAAGFVAGVVPDLDIVASLAGPYANWIHHRGMSHSIWFGPLAGPLFGWFWWQYYRWRRARAPDAPVAALGAPGMWKTWIGLFVVVYLTHPIIDLLTPYGTQLLAPLSTHRFAINAMPIIDPLYSLMLIAAILAGALTANRDRLAVAASCAALFFVAGYSLWAWTLNDRAEQTARAALAADGVTATAVTAYPTVFQPYLRRIVAKVPEVPPDGADEVWVGYLSTWAPQAIGWKRFPVQSGPQIDAVAASEWGRIFSWFALDQVYWTATPTPTGEVRVRASDLRYGAPGDTILGFWGIVGLVQPDGRLAGTPLAFRDRPDLDGAAVDLLWRATFAAEPEPP